MTVGNRRFRLCIENNLQRYNKATSKHERSLVVTSIVDAIRDSRTSEHGGFVRKDVASGRWYEVGDKTAREKVGHALRDAIKLKKREQQSHSIGVHDQERTNHHSRKRRRTVDIPVSQRDATNGQLSQLSSLPSTAYSRSSVANTSCKHPMGNMQPVVEAEWEISLKESTKQFQDSDDESDSVDDSFHGDARTLQRGSEKNPSPIHSATQSFNPPAADVGKNTTTVHPPGIEHGRSWNPPGFSDLEDHFAQNMRSFGGMPANEQVIESKEEALMATPFPSKTVHHTVLEDSSGKFSMPISNRAAQALPRFDSILICDSDDAGTSQ